MRSGISITLKPADRRRLKVLARDRNTPATTRKARVVRSNVMQDFLAAGH